MLNTFIQDKGFSKSIANNNTNEIKWNTDYNGKLANISLKLNNNGNRKKYNFSLNNNDLANLLNINTVNLPLEKRIQKDFNKNFRKAFEPKIFVVELEGDKNNIFQPNLSESTIPTPFINNQNDLQNDLQSVLENPLSEILGQKQPHISSPKTNEEFIIPLTVNPNSLDKYTFTTRKYHRRPRTHKSYKVYKHKKTSARSRNKSKSTSKSRKTSNSRLL